MPKERTCTYGHAGEGHGGEQHGRNQVHPARLRVGGEGQAAQPPAQPQQCQCGQRHRQCHAAAERVHPRPRTRQERQGARPHPQDQERQGEAEAQRELAQRRREEEETLAREQLAKIADDLAVFKRERRSDCMSIAGGDPLVLSASRLRAAVRASGVREGERRAGVDGVEQILDRCLGHPERSGRYHYHTIPACLTKGEKAGQDRHRGADRQPVGHIEADRHGQRENRAGRDRAAPRRRGRSS